MVQMCCKCLRVNSKAARFNRRSEDKIKNGHTEIRSESVDWIQEARNRIQWTRYEPLHSSKDEECLY
jgi:hypothetical protein